MSDDAEFDNFVKLLQEMKEIDKMAKYDLIDGRKIYTFYMPQDQRSSTHLDAAWIAVDGDYRGYGPTKDAAIADLHKGRQNAL